MFIDSHCHLDKLDLADYAGSFAQLLAATKHSKVNKMLCVSISLEDFAAMYQLVAGYSQIDVSMGVHPLHVKDAANIASVDKLLEMALEYKKVVAIGETGLDYFYDAQSKELQQQSFANHLIAAKSLDLPVIVHTRNAREDTLALIKEHGGQAGGVLHCFTESLAMAKKAIELNYLISISGIVTFKNSTELQDIVKSIPLDKLLIETDSPYLAPVPFRGKQNQPKYVVEVAQFIADLKGISVSKLADITSENYYTLFTKSTAD
ncbi:MAG: TatD family hydrolase [Oceanospirillaceae bacterium]